MASAAGRSHRGWSEMKEFPRLSVKLCDFLILIAAISLGMASLRTTISCLSHGSSVRHSPAMSSHLQEEPLYLGGWKLRLMLVHGVPLIVIASLTVVFLTIR